MSGGGFYRGTSQDQDARFSNKDKKLLNSIKWPEEFSKKVDIKKVNLEVIKTWITRKITELLNLEDDVVINLVINSLEAPDEKGVDPRKIQLNLAVFLQKNASKFTRELWNILLEAQNSPEGIPPALIENKKEEILSKKEALIKEAEKLENIKKFLENNQNSTKEAPSNLNKLSKMIKDRRNDEVSRPPEKISTANQQNETNLKQPSESSRAKEAKNERPEKVSKPSKRREETKKAKKKRRSSSRSSSENREREKAKARKQKQSRHRSRSRSDSRSKPKERHNKNRRNEKEVRKEEQKTKAKQEENRYSKKSAAAKAKEDSSDSDSDSSDSDSASSSSSASDSE